MGLEPEYPAAVVVLGVKGDKGRRSIKSLLKRSSGPGEGKGLGICALAILFPLERLGAGDVVLNGIPGDGPRFVFRNMVGGSMF